jgi:hypothetical protein
MQDNKIIYIFMDESGDLGFDFTKKATTKYFVMTFVYERNNWEYYTIIKNNCLRGLVWPK